MQILNCLSKKHAKMIFFCTKMYKIYWRRRIFFSVRYQSRKTKIIESDRLVWQWKFSNGWCCDGKILANGKLNIILIAQNVIFTHSDTAKSILCRILSSRVILLNGKYFDTLL